MGDEFKKKAARSGRLLSCAAFYRRPGRGA